MGAKDIFVPWGCSAFHSSYTSKCMFTYMWLMTSNGQFATAKFFQPSQYFLNIHLKIHLIFPSQSKINYLCKSGIRCQKSESDTCKQLSTNEEKYHCRKLAIEFLKPHPIIVPGMKFVTTNCCQVIRPGASTSTCTCT